MDFVAFRRKCGWIAVIARSLGFKPLLAIPSVLRHPVVSFYTMRRSDAAKLQNVKNN